MKKFVFALTSTLLIAFISYSQETHFGLKAGLNSSALKVKNAADTDSKLGFHAGGLAHIHISRHFALQPEVVFSMQGGKDDEGESKLNYINVPVLAQYMFNEGFRIQTGPQVGFLISAKRDVNDIEIDVKDVYSSIDFSWTFGAGYMFPGGVGIDARYNLGINDILESDQFEVRNNVFQVGLFYQFMHKKVTTK